MWRSVCRASGRYPYRESFTKNETDRCFSVEYLPGQFDQRADSAEQCIRFIKEDETPVIRTAVTYVIEGNISEEEFEAIKITASIR